MNMPIRRALHIPPLEPGDRLTREEFEQRYFAMPEVKKAELIDGEVYLPSPVRLDHHASPHASLVWLIHHYAMFTPGVTPGDNATVRLDKRNEPQPDAILIVRPEWGGQVKIDDTGYLKGAPDLAIEVSGSSASIDLGKKLAVYEQHKTREYLVWRVYEDVIDWFALTRGKFALLATDPDDGLLKSRAFPGLWLDAAALLRGDLAAVLAALTQGVQSPEHLAFVAKLAAKKAKK